MDKKFLDYEGVSFYDDLIKEHVAEEVELTHLNDATIPDVQLLDEPYENNIDALADDVANKVATAFMSITAETVTVVVTTQVPGLSVANLTLNVIYNDNPTKIAQLPITDGNGMCSFRVPNGYTYKIIFPDRPNCHEIIPVQHTAAILLRSVEVEYIGESQEEELKGRITVNIRDFANHTYSNVSDITITASYNGTSVQATTNSSGNANFYIPYGATYTITIPNREERYILYNKNTKTGTVLKGHEVLRFIYYAYDVGIFIVTEDGDLYNFEEWQNLVEIEQTKLNSEALYIRVVTDNLVRNGGTFAVSIDTIRNRNITTAMWQEDLIQVPTTVIPNGNKDLPSSLYYYDGYSASKAVRQWGDDDGHSFPAINKCLNTYVTINNVSVLGFLGSQGLWTALFSRDNKNIINSILEYTRPEGTYNLNSLNDLQKWTCVQEAANRAYGFKTAITQNNTKANSNYVLPFFAY